MEPSRQLIVAEVDEALEAVNGGSGATAAEILHVVRVRFATTTAAVVKDVLEAGVKERKYFQFILPNMAIAYGRVGSWLAEDAALSAFIDMTS